MIDRNTGRTLDPRSPRYLDQAIADVIGTPIGTRPYLRAYGSEVPFLVDQPMSRLTVQRLFAATASALMRWLPIVRLTRVLFERLGPGQARLRIFGRRNDLPNSPAFETAFPLTLTAA